MKRAVRLCPSCGRQVNVSKNGVVAKHKDVLREGTCPGSRRVVSR